MRTAYEKFMALSIDIDKCQISNGRLFDKLWI